MESHDVLTRKRCPDFRLVEKVGSDGQFDEGREGADDDEAGRDRRELRDAESECVIHDQQVRANTRRTERDVYRWRWTMLVAASQTRVIGKMWTTFEGHYVPIADDGTLRKIL